MDTDPLVVPELPDSIDMATMAVSVVGSAVPLAGGALVEIANRCLRANHEAAMQDFHRALADRVNALDDDGQLLQRLQAPEFTEMLTRTVRVAEATSQHEKRVWLANAVVNCLRADAPDNLDRLRNLRLIDQLLPVHVHVLRFLSDPSPRLAQWGTCLPTDPDSGDANVLAAVVPELPDAAFADLVLTDLHEMELVSNMSRRNFAALVDGEGEEDPYTLPPVLPRALSLLKFIDEPA